MLNQYDIDYIIKCLKDGQSIPAEYKYSLFPTIQKEYELAYAGKMRKEDWSYVNKKYNLNWYNSSLPSFHQRVF